jgi:hypothetical protein
MSRVEVRRQAGDIRASFQVLVDRGRRPLQHRHGNVESRQRNRRLCTPRRKRSECPPWHPQHRANPLPGLPHRPVARRTRQSCASSPAQLCLGRPQRARVSSFFPARSASIRHEQWDRGQPVVHPQPEPGRPCGVSDARERRRRLIVAGGLRSGRPRGSRRSGRPGPLASRAQRAGIGP